MFDFIKNIGKNKLLEAAIASLHMNMSNNYKDAAQLNLKELETLYQELKQKGKVNEKQATHYEAEIYALQHNLRGFTHKDQKPYWT